MHSKAEGLESYVIQSVGTKLIFSPSQCVVDLPESGTSATLPGPLATRLSHPAGLQAQAVCTGGWRAKGDRPR